MRLSPLLLIALVAAGCSKADDKPAPKPESKEGTAAATATGAATGEATGAAKATGAEVDTATGGGTAAGTEAATGEGGTAPATGADPGTAKQPDPPGNGTKGGGEPAAKTTWQIMDQEGAHGPDDTFDLKIDAPAHVAPGSAAKFELTVTPGAAYKINVCDAGEADCTPYPIKLEVMPPAGVSVPKPKQTQDDVVAVDKKHLVIAFEATPDAAGNYTIPAKFKFAVCQDEFCKPRKVELSFALAAK